MNQLLKDRCSDARDRLPVLYENVGLHEFCQVDDSGHEIRSTLWYPARPGTGQKKKYLSLLPAQARTNAQPEGSGHPLVIISHCFGGNQYNQAYLAEYLAARGFACLAPLHRDSATREKWTHLFERPRALCAALHQFKMTDMLRYVDPENIILIGHSAGAFTCLIAAGATPRFDQEATFEPVRGQLETFRPDLCRIPGCAAVILMAPALSNLFDRNGLAAAAMPSLVLEAEHENVRLLGTASAYATQLQNTEYARIEGAGHYAFINCLPKFLATLSPVPAGGDLLERHLIHQEIFRRVEAFLIRHLPF